MQQANEFPITITMKNGKLRVISTLPHQLIQPLLKRVIRELEVPYQDRHYYQEEAEEADGTSNALYYRLQGIDADALCFLTSDGQFAFILLGPEQRSEAENYQRLMREKLQVYMDSGGAKQS